MHVIYNHVRFVHDLCQSLPDHKTNNNDNPKNAKEKKKWKRQSDHNRNHVFEVDEIILKIH